MQSTVSIWDLYHQRCIVCHLCIYICVLNYDQFLGYFCYLVLTVTVFQCDISCGRSYESVLEMAEKVQPSSQQPIVKIGHYTLGQTLGVGTFGKVKSK